MNEATGRVTYPVQLHINHTERRGEIGCNVHQAAYEVYAHVYGHQQSLLQGDCRGGFGVGELIAFLYARGFPKEQWQTRVALAFSGMKLKA